MKAMIKYHLKYQSFILSYISHHEDLNSNQLKEKR